MSAKRPGSIGNSRKRNRRAIDLETKMNVIAQSEAGRKVKDIAEDLALPHSTISTIIKDKERIHKAVEGCAPLKATVLTKQRLGHIHEMEKLLMLWIQDQTHNLVPLTSTVITAKARSILSSLREKDGDESPCTFRASLGWFANFKKRFGLHNDRVAEAAVNMDGSDKYIDALNVLLKREGYLPEQVCSPDEVGNSYWKKMADRPYDQEILDEATPIPSVKVEFDEEEQPPVRQFTTEGLAEALSMVNSGLAILAGMDCDEERYANIERQIKESIRCYQEIYDERTKATDQTALNIDMKPVFHTDLSGRDADSASETVLG